MAYLTITRQAHNDLMEIWRYIADQSNPDRADAFLDKVHRKLELFAAQPGTGRSRNDLREGLRSAAVSPYIAFYIVSEDGIEVVRVLHGRRDIDTAFTEEYADLDDDDELL
jgi:toxin ParE1/3/4